MLRKWLPRLGLAVLAVALWAGSGSNGFGRRRPAPAALLLLPLLLLPHSYWPQNSPQWPEPKGHPYVRPAGVHGLPAVQGAGLALRAVRHR